MPVTKLRVVSCQNKSAGASRPQRPSPRPLAPSPYRKAITLIEMLVALAVTLLMMGAVVSIFGWIGNSVSDSRASIEIAERLRAARNRLQLDLQSATAQMDPPRRPESDEGYLEYIEGPRRDSDFDSSHKHNILGDNDDILMLTIRSRGEPFVGKGAGVAIESQSAEVVWYMYPSRIIQTSDSTQPIQLCKLCRRQLLVYPSASAATTPWATFFSVNDVSARVDSAGTGWVGNTLGDLTKPENRYAHIATPGGPAGGYPFRVDLPIIDPPPSGAALYPFPVGSGRTGEDVILDNVLAFNVQAYDPGAPIYPDPPTGTMTGTITPSDAKYVAQYGSAGAAPISYGAYVDLGYAYTSASGLISHTVGAGAPNPLFADRPTDKHRRVVLFTQDPVPSMLSYDSSSKQAQAYTYDTFSLHYENNGLNEDGDADTDEGTNGLDDGTPTGNGAVDDPAEYETQPPYSARLRGLQIKIRVYEPDSRQVREVTVVQDFLPQ